MPLVLPSFLTQPLYLRIRLFPSPRPPRSPPLSHRPGNVPAAVRHPSSSSLVVSVPHRSPSFVPPSCERTVRRSPYHRPLSVSVPLPFTVPPSLVASVPYCSPSTVHRRERAAAARRPTVHRLAIVPSVVLRTTDHRSAGARVARHPLYHRRPSPWVGRCRPPSRQPPFRRPPSPVTVVPWGPTISALTEAAYVLARRPEF